MLIKGDLYTATGKDYTLRAEENGKINKKHAPFHKYISK
jgi:hypothetical protein